MKIEDAKESLESAINELKRMRMGDDCVLGSTIYHDLNTIPMSVNSSVYWILINLESAYEDLDGNLDEV